MDEAWKDGPFTYRDIRVPSRVVRVWRDETGWYCALEDGRVYQGEWPFDEVAKKVTGEPKWVPFLPPVPDR